MDFFESQDDARRHTGRLVLLFVLAVLAIVVTVYLLVAGVLVWQSQAQVAAQQGGFRTLWDPRLLAVVGVGTLAVVGGGSLYKVAQLRGGGPAVAEHLGGKLLNADRAGEAGRRVLNVVEEMAIASGTPVPLVYLLDHEEGINAFAAGYSPDDAVIGVTRGCAELLSRDQLQGVVAHEFSHILNGDMRLNLRLIGILHGILVIGLLGQTVLRSMRFGLYGRRRSSGRGGGGVAAVLAIALGLMVVGFAGVFFGNLIQAAVSRQREFLADAAAVQFTRNPEGIAGALKAIGGLSRGSLMGSPNAAEASHLLFGMGLKRGLGSPFATHPPLDVRIRRLDPAWDGTFPVIEAPPPKPELAAGGPAAPGAAARFDSDAVRAAVGFVGRPGPAHLDHARQLLGSLPPRLSEAARETYGARAVLCALLLSRERGVRDAQLGQLEEHLSSDAHLLTCSLAADVLELDARLRLPLLDLAIPSLRALSPSQFDELMSAVDGLVAADREVDLFEWSLLKMLRRHLEPHFREVRPPKVAVYGLQRLQEECRTLLSVLAQVGHQDEQEQAAAYAAGAELLGLSGTSLLAAERCGTEALDGALDRLAEASPLKKRELLAACALCIASDRTITVQEAELLRALSDGLGCPMPPILAGQPLA
jgi:Zn-dependent protease with chaperone function